LETVQSIIIIVHPKNFKVIDSFRLFL